MSKEDLKPYNSVIQICPDCGKVDVCKDDNHECDREAEERSHECDREAEERRNLDYSDDYKS